MAQVGYPRILETKRTGLSPWATLLEKQVQFGAGDPQQTYHCMTQSDYVGVLAVTPDGLPIVRQAAPGTVCGGAGSRHLSPAGRVGRPR